MRQGKRSSLSRAPQQAAGKHRDNYLPLFSTCSHTTCLDACLVSSAATPVLAGGSNESPRILFNTKWPNRDSKRGYFYMPNAVLLVGVSCPAAVTLNQPPSAARATGKHQG